MASFETRRVERVMGTVVTVATPAGAPAAALDEVFAWFRWVDRTFSVHRPDSQVSRVSAGELAPGRAHPLVDEVLDYCARLFRETEGWFDAWPGGPAGGVDPSGYVKGWSVDVAAALLAGAGVSHCCIAAGGDVRVAGARPGGAAWRIGIQHPGERQAVAAVLQAEDLAVATSGAYERGPHIRGEREGRPLLSATVAGPRLGVADALATALFAAGGAAGWLERFPSYHCLLITRDRRVRWAPGLDACLVPAAAAV